MARAGRPRAEVICPTLEMPCRAAACADGCHFKRTGAFPAADYRIKPAEPPKPPRPIEKDVEVWDPQHKPRGITRNQDDAVHEVMYRLEAREERAEVFRGVAAARRELDEEIARAERRAAKAGKVLPTPERLSVGDIEQTPIRYGDQRDADPNRPTVARSRKSSDDPLREFLARRLISEAAYFAGQQFGRLYERAIRESGAINLDSLGGGSCDGLSYARAEAMSELHAMCRMLGGSAHDQLVRGRVLIAVCGERRTIRAYAGDGGRARQQASNVLVNGLEALARAREAA